MAGSGTGPMQGPGMLSRAPAWAAEARFLESSPLPSKACIGEKLVRSQSSDPTQVFWYGMLVS